MEAVTSTAPSLERRLKWVLKFVVLPLKVPFRFKFAGMLTEDGIIPGETNLAISVLLVLKSLMVRSKYERLTLGSPLIIADALICVFLKPVISRLGIRRSLTLPITLPFIKNTELGECLKGSIVDIDGTSSRTSLRPRWLPSRLAFILNLPRS